MRVALIGEGKNDVGIEDGRGDWREGAVQPIIRKFLPTSEFLPLKPKRKESNFGVPSYNIPRFKIRAAKLRKFLEVFNEIQGSIDLLVFYQDLDKQFSGKATEIEAKRAFREAMEDVEDAFAYIKDRWRIPAIAMIPMRMLENWLLADEKAFEHHFGLAPQNPRLPNDPEFIWGDEQDRNSNHPKNYLQRVLSQFAVDSTTGNFILIAEASNANLLRERLPNSFEPFARKMELFINEKLRR
jgi:hypothetical protein